MGTILIITLVALVAFLLFRSPSGNKSPTSGSLRDGRATDVTAQDYEDDEDDAEDERDRDAWEGAFWDAADPKPVHARLKLSYEDGAGRATTRVVRVRKFDHHLHGGILIGHCELREGTRTFRFDRVRLCIDLDTGEAVSDVRAHLNRLYESSPEYSIERLQTDYLDVLKVLFFVAKADGQYRKEEEAVVADYLRQLLKDDRITTDLVDGALSQIDVPSLHGFKLALGRVLRGGEVDPKLLQTCCHSIVETQSTAHPSEQAALDYLDRKATLTTSLHACSPDSHR